MVDCLDEPIDQNTEKLFDIAAEFWDDEFLVNFFGTKANNCCIFAEFKKNNSYGELYRYTIREWF